MSSDLVDRIYEAAFVPDCWTNVLDQLSVRSQSVGGVLLVASQRFPPRWLASEAIDGAVNAFSSGSAWRQNDRPARYLEADSGSFLRDVDFLSETYLAADPMRQELVDYGLGWQTGTVIPMPAGEVVIYSFERRLDDGPHDPRVPGLLNELRPHLARSGMIAARLGLEKAQATVSGLAALGLPAAVLSESGRVLTGNALFDQLSEVFLPVALGGLAIADSAANALFQEAIAASRFARQPLVRSIPVKSRIGAAPAIVHVLPLRRAAHDIFSGADILVVATEVKADANVAASRILVGLFDLTPAEARLAQALAGGNTLRKIADEMGIRFDSARTYLSRIFSKTGTRQQSELVALLKSTQHLTDQNQK